MADLIFHPDTIHEIKASYRWYQKQAEGLGEDFITELESAYAAIEKLPRTWPKFSKNCRRFLLRKFPFSIIYHVDTDSIFILAVMHNSRKPNYWENRSSEDH